MLLRPFIVGALPQITMHAAHAAACTTPVTLDASTNIWQNYTLHTNSIYQQAVIEAISNINDEAERSKAMEVADTGNFAWIESTGDIEKIDHLAQNVPCRNIIGLVIFGLPFRTCSAPDPLPIDDAWYYSQAFIRPIVERIKAYPNTAFAVIIEPGIMEMYALDATGTCQHIRDSWHRNVPPALQALDLPNIITYLDGANGRVFGWTGRPWQGSTSTPPPWFHQNEGTAVQGATELTNTWRAAGALTQFRGLAVNVRGYNSWDLTPPESFRGENTCYDLYNKGRNEERYLNYLYNAGFRVINSSMPFHNIMDTSRNGRIGIRENWSDWCNVNGAGIGVKPGAVTKGPFLDAFVWASGPAVSDGASDVRSESFPAECADSMSFKPMPDRDEFSLEYFRMMLGGCKGCSKVKARRELEARCG